MSDTDSNLVGNTLLERVCIVFEQINRTGGVNHSWREAWRKALQLEDAPEINLYDGLSLVGRAIERIQGQVNMSRNMSARAKGIASPILGELYACVLPSNLHVPANQSSNKFSVERLNVLRLAADVLEKEFAEPRIPNAEWNELVNLVNELVKVIEDKNIPQDLAKFLTPHIKFVQWAVQNYHVIGVDGLQRAITMTGLYLRRVDAPEQATATNVSWWAKIRSNFHRIYKIVDAADKAVRIGERGYYLAGEVGDMIDKIPS